MMTSVHYGHMIKHLEASHLDALPVPSVEGGLLAEFSTRTNQMLDLRNRAYDGLLLAESLFEEATGGRYEEELAKSHGFASSSAAFKSGRRRLEASFYNPVVDVLTDRLKAARITTAPLSDLTLGIWWGARFRRVFGDGGIPYFSADDLWTLNPAATKNILLDYENAADATRYMVKPGWLIMACSGQVYGLNGSVDMVTKKLATSFLSHDLIRIVPNDDVRPGYLLVALSHPRIGRPLVLRNAYGSSIPHLDPDDVAEIPIPRLSKSLEQEIADVAEEAVRQRHEADALENAITADAEGVIERFLANGTA